MAMETLDRSLRYFLRIAELGSLSKAAEALDQTQSGLSKQLAVLESSLGLPLFVRTGRGVELTEAGSRLYDVLQASYREIDQAVESVRQRGFTHGTVHMATVHTLSYYFTADVVARFVSTRPHVNLSLLGRSSPEVVALVESGKADLGLVYDVAVDTDRVVSHLLFDDEMSLIVPHDSPLVGAQDLSGMNLRLVGFPPHYALRRMLHSAGLRATYATEAETVDAMLKLVSSGIGDCILPSRIPNKLLADNGLRQVPIAAPTLRRRAVAITPVGKPLSPLTSGLLQCVMNVAGELRHG